MFKNYESFTENGQMVFQRTVQVRERYHITKAVYKSNNLWALYSFSRGRGQGHPLRSKSRQPQILAFIDEAKKGLGIK